MDPNTLSDELWLLILEWVPPLDVLRAVSPLSRRFHQLACFENFWLLHPLLPLRLRSDTNNDVLNQHQRQRICLLLANRNPELAPTFLQVASVLPGREELRCAYPASDPYARVPCFASTTDNPSQESLRNVLPKNSNYNHREDANEMWWSSGPSLSDASETLMFATKHPLTMLLKFKLLPLVDPHHRSFSYTWRQTVIRVYHLREQSPAFQPGTPCMFRRTVAFPHLPNHDARQPGVPFISRILHSNYYEKNDQVQINQVLEGHSPVYESDVFEVDASGFLEHTFPPGVVGNVVTAQLIGKDKEQFEGSNEFFSCVQRVNCLGIPLF